MKNNFRLRGDVVHIALRRGGRRGTEYIWTVIDAADFDLVDSFPGSWVAKWNETAQTFYARCNSGNGFKGCYLHRFILGITNRKVQIDHRNHNGLANKRNNLVVSNVRLNGFNRRGAEQGSMSGCRNVYWNQREKKYMVWFVHDGKRYYFGYFADLEQADRVARKERAKFL